MCLPLISRKHIISSFSLHVFIFTLFESLGYLIFYFFKVLTSFGLLSKILNFETFSKNEVLSKNDHQFWQVKDFVFFCFCGEREEESYLAFYKIWNFKVLTPSLQPCVLVHGVNNVGYQSISGITREFTCPLFTTQNALPALHVPNPHYPRAIGNRILGVWNKWIIRMEKCKRTSGPLYPGDPNGWAEQKFSPVPWWVAIKCVTYGLNLLEFMCPCHFLTLGGLSFRVRALELRWGSLPEVTQEGRELGFSTARGQGEVLLLPWCIPIKTLPC